MSSSRSLWAGSEVGLPVNQSTIEVRALAHAYRRLVLWFGVQLLHPVASGVARATGSGALTAFLVLIGPFVIIGTLLAMAFYGYGTAKALGSRVAWLWAVAMTTVLSGLIDGTDRDATHH